MARRIDRWSAIAVSALLLAALFQPPAYAEDPAEGERWDTLIKVRSAGGVIASESLEASQAGLEVLKADGNAIDAAIATTFAIGVTRPEMCGIGGGGFLVYRGADGSTAALDFRETAPAAMHENTFNKASDGGATSERKPGIHNDRVASGHTVVGVPGVVAGMDEALKELGSGNLSLAQLIAPAERLAREGIYVSSNLAGWFVFDQIDPFRRIANYPESARLYGGRFVHTPFPYDRTGQREPDALRFKQLDYAKSLRQIMDHGPDAFYEQHDYPHPILPGLTTPSIGKLIVSDMATAEESAKLNPVLMAKTNGQPNDVGLIEAEDLANYEPKWKTPLRDRYRDHQVIAMPPPGAGMVAIEILNLLENFNLASFGHSSADHIHALAEAQKLAWADRKKYLADPDFPYDYDGDGTTESVPVDVLTSKRYAQQRVSEIDMGTAKSVSQYGHGTLTPPHGGSHTTHLSVIDRDGNAAAITCTLNSPFGSGVIAPGTGFFLNNELADFDWTWEGITPANAPGDGKRPASSMSPTIVVKAEQPVLVTGGAGSTAIILGVVQNILNVVDFNLDIFHAIDAPRVDGAGFTFTSCGERLMIEHLRIADEFEAELTDRGHDICRLRGQQGSYADFPLIASAGTDPVTGERLAVSDPRALWTSPADQRVERDDQGPVGEKD